MCLASHHHDVAYQENVAWTNQDSHLPRMLLEEKVVWSVVIRQCMKLVSVKGLPRESQWQV